MRSKWTVSEIASSLEQGLLSGKEIEELKKDSRKSVQQLLQRHEKRQEQKRKELQRLRRMFRLERAVQRSGYAYVAGVDEAGRGPLAGPVVAAAVVLPPGLILNGLNDSKKIPHLQRERLYQEIQEKAEALGWGMAGVEEIDRLNIYHASLLAMNRAVGKVEEKADFVLVDGFPLKGLNLPQRPVKRGDSLCASIAAASIVAKVTRDEIMQELDRQYPAYGFASHKGYATREHREAVKRFGPAPPHRRSFLHNL